MIKNFRNKSVVVTGGGSGIGRSLVHAFVKAGAQQVAVTDISQDRLDGIVAEFESSATKVCGYRVDHSSEEQTKAFAEQVRADFGGVDVVCANAGIGGGGLFEKTMIAEWRKMIDINLLGVVYTLRYFVPAMIERGKGGALLITASGAGLVPGPGSACYHMTKAAVSNLGQTLHAELAIHDIGVSVLCPGVIKTGITDVGASTITFGDTKKDQAAARNLYDFYVKHGVSPDIVAADALRGLKKNKMIIITPTSHILAGWLLYRLSPALLNKLVVLPRWRKGTMISGVKLQES